MVIIDGRRGNDGIASAGGDVGKPIDLYDHLERAIGYFVRNPYARTPDAMLGVYLCLGMCVSLVVSGCAIFSSFFSLSQLLFVWLISQLNAFRCCKLQFFSFKTQFDVSMHRTIAEHSANSNDERTSRVCANTKQRAQLVPHFRGRQCTGDAK